VSKQKQHTHTTHKQSVRPPFECIALLLQGGGALGAYQCGVYEALAEAHLCPDWVAGISIGAINSAIIAGNTPETRVVKLRQFWEKITSNPIWNSLGGFDLPPMFNGDLTHTILNRISAGLALASGTHGFFEPRFPSPWLHESGAPGAISYYDTSSLKATLEEFVDFDLLNQGMIHLSIGAVNIRNGNFVYFDTQTHTITPEHVMASGALPPGFPPIEIDGEFYWDGGLVSNTPLEWVFYSKKREDTLAFQVDLWSARGHLPRDMAEVLTRQKEIQFSSRTRAATDRFKHAQRMRHTFSQLYKKLPEDLKKSPEAKILAAATNNKVYNIAHLIYHAQNYEGDSKDYEFSRASMEEHWKAGYSDTVHTLRHPEVLERPTNHEGVFIFDIAEEGCK